MSNEDLLRQLEGWTDKDGHHPGLLHFQGATHAMRITLCQLAWIEPQYPTTASGTDSGSRSTGHNDLANKLATRPDPVATEAQNWAQACNWFALGRAGNVTEPWQWHEVIKVARRTKSYLVDLGWIPDGTKLADQARIIRQGATARTPQTGQTQPCMSCRLGVIKPHETWCSNMSCDRNKSRCVECKSICLPSKMRHKGTLCEACDRRRRRAGPAKKASKRLFGNGCHHPRTIWSNGHKTCLTCSAKVVD